MNHSPISGGPRRLRPWIVALAAAAWGGCAQPHAGLFEEQPAYCLEADIQKMVAAVSAQRIQRDVETLASFGTRHTLSDTTSGTRGIGAARRWILGQFEAIAAGTNGRMTVALEGEMVEPPAPRIPAPVEVLNVVATLHGRDPQAAKRVYVVSGHYDSICSDVLDSECDAPGANDDASGTAAVLEMARVMSGHEFAATIVFAAVAGEEQGLYGSKYLAEKYRRDGVNVAGMFTNDIIGSSAARSGRADKSRVRVFSEGVPEIETPDEAKLRLATGSENDSAARQLARFVAESCELYVADFEVMLMYRRDRLMRGGDHTPFSRAGFPAVRFTEVHEDYRHQHQTVREEAGVRYGDLPEFVDADYVAGVARVNVAALARLARGPASPVNVRIVLDKLGPETKLRWDAPPEPGVKAYEVVARDTTAVRWTHVAYVRDATECVVDLSKDNYFFGVRAGDGEGRPSVVAFAQPADR